MVAAGSLDLKQYCPGLITPFVLRISIPVATAPRMSLPIFQQHSHIAITHGKNQFNTFHTVRPALEVPEIYAVDTPGWDSTVLSVITSCERILPMPWLRLQGRLLFLSIFRDSPLDGRW